VFYKCLLSIPNLFFGSLVFGRSIVPNYRVFLFGFILQSEVKPFNLLTQNTAYAVKRYSVYSGILGCARLALVYLRLPHYKQVVVPFKKLFVHEVHFTKLYVSKINNNFPGWGLCFTQMGTQMLK
jgi:hypothetical protein